MALKKIFSLLFSDYRMYIHDTVSPLKSVFNCSRYFFVSEVWFYFLVVLVVRTQNQSISFSLLQLTVGPKEIIGSSHNVVSASFSSSVVVVVIVVVVVSVVYHGAGVVDSDVNGHVYHTHKVDRYVAQEDGNGEKRK